MFRHMKNSLFACGTLKIILKDSLARVGFSTLTVLVGICFSSVTYAQARSIEEFLQQKENWEEFTLIDYEWRLEGRFAFVSGTTMTFPHCTMPFHIPDDIVRNRGSTGAVELTGRIAKVDGKLVFRVNSITSRPKDRDRLRAMRFDIDPDQPEQWYKIADWGHRRAKFYEDAELAQDARALDQQGVVTALRRLKSDDENGLEVLLVTAREKKVDESLLQQILHQSLHVRWNALRKAKWNGAAYAELEADLTQQLPGSRDQLKRWPEDLSQKYAREPIDIYANTPVEDRLTLHRLFLVSLVSEIILHDALPDGSNGFEIANRFRKETPERPEQAQQWIRKGIAFHQARLPNMTRSQLDEYTRKLELEDESILVREARQKWLLAREPHYRAEGARGLADLANQWMSLLRDQSTATQFYIESWTVNKDYAPASEWLTSHGMRLVDGRWMTEEAIKAMPLSPIDQAIRDGRIEVGMTRNQVLSTLGGPPDRLTRIATSQGVGEWWEYDATGVVIRFARNRRSAEAVVEKIDAVSPP